MFSFSFFTIPLNVFQACLAVTMTIREVGQDRDEIGHVFYGNLRRNRMEEYDDMNVSRIDPDILIHQNIKMPLVYAQVDKSEKLIRKFKEQARELGEDFEKKAAI